MDQHSKTAIATIAASVVTAFATVTVGYLGLIKPSERQLEASPIVIQLQQTNQDQASLIAQLRSQQAELTKANESLRQEAIKQKHQPKSDTTPDTSKGEVGTERVTREVSLNEAITFDSDVTASVSGFNANGPTVWVNGKNQGYQSVGARFEAKRDSSRLCFVELMGVNAGEGTTSKPKFRLDYFCTSPR